MVPTCYTFLHFAPSTILVPIFLVDFLFRFLSHYFAAAQLLTTQSAAHADSDRLGLDVVVEGSLAQLAADTRLLEATERQLVVEHVVACRKIVGLVAGALKENLREKLKNRHLQLTQTVPALRPFMTRMLRLRSLVWTAAARP